MLPIIVLLLVLTYLILDRSGMLEEFASAVQKTRKNWPPPHPEMENPPPPDAESERRLEVFEDFIEGLDPNNDDDEG